MKADLTIKADLSIKAVFSTMRRDGLFLSNQIVPESSL
jgi:hypothetical protein